MIELLTSMLAPLTLVLALLLLLNKPLLNKTGANSAYYAWALVPISLLAYSLPMNWEQSSIATAGNISRFIISSQNTLSQNLQIDWLGFIWLGVSCTFVLFWLLSHFNFIRKLHLKSVDLTHLNVDMPENLKVYQSAHVFSPMLVGLVQSKLVVPEDFGEIYNREQQQLILQHEICHFDRNDIYWNLLAFACLALFWFHPLVWLGYFRFRRDQELSCDQTVLARKHLNSRINYSKALLVAAENTPPIAFAQLSFNEYRDKSIMFERIKHIKANSKINKVGVSVLAFLSVFTLSSMSYAGNVGDKGHQSVDKQVEAIPVIRIEPKYPLVAVEQNLSGSVRLAFDINEYGETENIRVTRSKPAGIFDESAKTALAKWKYEPHNYGMIRNNQVQLDFRLAPPEPEEQPIERIAVYK